MKKFIISIIVIILLFYTGALICSSKKNSDIRYAVEKYCTTGLFNEYKLYRMDNWEVEFSDGNMAIISVTGLQYKSPHDYINYKILLEKNKDGLWKLKKYYKVQENP